MKKAIAAMGAAAVLASAAQGAATVGIDDSTAPWLGYMNVFELDGTSFVFESGWGVPDLTATFDDGAGTVTMGATPVDTGDGFWYTNGTGGPGADGNKVMEANMYQQVDDGSLSGMEVTFEGTLISNTMAEHDVRVFIRDFAADFSSSNDTFVDVSAAGDFSISLNTDAGAGRHVQWGIQVKGVNSWSTDVGNFGTAVFGPIPAPGSAALLGLGGLVATRRRR